jgi:uncharacterized protein YjbI with pentapeptide repeats
MQRNQATIWSWLGLRNNFDYSKAKPLGALAGVLLLILCVSFFLTALTSLYLLFVAMLSVDLSDQDPTGAAIRNIGLVAVAMFGGPFVIWRSIVAQRQVDVAEQGQITDRISKAVEGLGSVRSERRVIESDNNEAASLSQESLEFIEPNLEVRIGAIFALERISQDSLRDHIQIMEILSAYIRNNCKREIDIDFEIDRINDAPDYPKRCTPLRADLWTALLVIGRRSPSNIEYERSLDSPYSIDLQGANFSGVNIDKIDLRFSKLNNTVWSYAGLRWANFSGAHIDNGDFRRADLEYVNFNDSWLFDVSFECGSVAEGSFASAYLSQCDFGKCGLEATKFSDTRIEFCDFRRANLGGASFGASRFFRSVLETAQLFGTDFSRVTEMDQKCLEGTLGIKTGDGMTAIPAHLIPPENWLKPTAFENGIDALAVYEDAYEVMMNADGG